MYGISRGFCNGGAARRLGTDWRTLFCPALLELAAHIPNTRGLLNPIPNTRGLLNLIPNTRGLLNPHS